MILVFNVHSDTDECEVQFTLGFFLINDCSCIQHFYHSLENMYITLSSLNTASN